MISAKDSSGSSSNKRRTRCYLKLAQGSQPLGTLHITLYNDIVPKTCRNFEMMISSRNDKEALYKSTKFHRIIPGFMAQGGDYENGNGTGGKSIYGDNFEDENFIMGHSGRGILSMANSGRNTNGSQFFICFKATPHLDGKHVVFGSVDMNDDGSCRVIDLLEGVRTKRRGRDMDCPCIDVIIDDCGVSECSDTSLVSSQQQHVDYVDSIQKGNNEDDDEIDLDDDHDENDDGDENEGKREENIAIDSTKSVQKGEDELIMNPPEKMNPLQKRLFNLKMKLNQSRRLNRTEVLAEGARLGSMEGMLAEKKKTKALDRKARKADWQDLNKKIGGKVGDSHLFELSSTSQAKFLKKEERAIANRYEVNDMYNPGGHHRSYQRDLKSLSKGVTGRKSHDTYDPLTTNDNDANATKSEGARILGEELRGRADKKKKRDVEIEGDVDYINKRNKRFNQKIERNYGKYTAEIKQNLERGTAL